MYDLRSGTGAPLPSGKGTIIYPIWSPDGKQVAFTSNRSGNQQDIYVKPVGGGSSEQLLLGGEGDKQTDRWSADGRYILFDYNGEKTKATDMWALPLFGDRKPFPVVQTPGVDYYGMFSADGKWVAYDSDESGRGEIYVVPFRDREASGRFPRAGARFLFGRKGKELFYLTAGLQAWLASNTLSRERILRWASHGSFSADAPWPSTSGHRCAPQRTSAGC